MITSFPPTEVFAKCVLGAMAIHKDLKRKAIVLWAVLKSDLLPYAPKLPDPDAKLVISEISAQEAQKYNRRAAMLLRLLNFGHELDFAQVADLLQKILPEENPARTLFLANFLEKYAEKVMEKTKNEIYEALKDRGINIDTPSAVSKDSENATDKKPPKKTPRRGGVLN